MFITILVFFYFVIDNNISAYSHPSSSYILHSIIAVMCFNYDQIGSNNVFCLNSITENRIFKYNVYKNTEKLNSFNLECRFCPVEWAKYN